MTIIDASAFAECEKEPLANSGFIQPNGALLFIERATGTFRYISANVQDLLGETAEELLGRDGRDWVEQNIPDLAALPANAGKRIHLAQALDMGLGELDVLISATSSGWLLEFERAQAAEHDPLKTQLLTVVAPLNTAKIAALQQSLVECIAGVSGYDRVMLYQFGSDWSGEVLAETVTLQEGQYLGLRFPASDIPAIARNLYAQTPYRHIPDSSASPIPLLAKAGSGTLLDLTWSDLRSVSPMHMQYLTNMRVLSSFSVSVMVEGKLWGLLACHHPEPRIIPLAARERCKDLAAEFVTTLLSYRKSVQRGIFEAVSACVEPAKKSVEQGTAVLRALADQFGPLSNLVGNNGGALFVDDQLTLLGNTADSTQATRIHQWALKTQSEAVFAVDNLPALMGEATTPNTICGVAGMNLRSRHLGNTLISLYFFRPEEAGEVAWAGNPNKPLEATPEGQRLSPRSSFEKWVQIRSGQARSWTEDEVFAANQLREQLAKWL